MKSQDVDQTYGEGVTIDLKPGMAWVLVSDTGPVGPCGQSGRTTCPHMVLLTFPDEDAMRKALETPSWRKGKGQRVMWGIVDNYIAGGVFRVIQHEEKRPEITSRPTGEHRHSI